MVKLLRVADAPPHLLQALRARGHSDDDEMTPRRALEEWAAWNIGDGSWASAILDLYDEAVEAANKGTHHDQ